MINKQTIVISTPISKKRALNAVMECMGDNVMQMTLEPYQHDKTSEQRKWWHKMIAILANEIGYTPQEMKNILKVQILGVETVTDWKGRTIEQIPSSEDEKRHGYSKLIDETYRIAAELGVILPNPGEYGKTS